MPPNKATLLEPVEPPKPAGPPNPLAMIQTAIERGMDPDQLGKLMDLQERWEKNRAAEAFAGAVADFQARCPRIVKHRTAKVATRDGKEWTYKFASLDDVMDQAGPILADAGLAVSFSTEAAAGGMKVTCRIRKGIHFEDSTLTLPIPAASVNDTQRGGMALSYLKRYALCAALNIIVTDEDDDAATAGMDLIGEKQVLDMEELMKEKRVDTTAYLKFAKVERLDQILKSDVPKLMDMLRRKVVKP